MAERWVAELLDRSERPRDVELRIRSGKLDWSIFKSVPGSGSISLSQPAEIDLLHDRIRIWNERDGVRTSHGIWLISVPGTKRQGPITTADFALSDKTELLNSPVGSWLTLPAGTTVTPQVEQIIIDRGEPSPEIVASSSSLSVAMTWSPDDTWLKVANELLATINFTSLWADEDGRLIAEPYVDPGRREVTLVYGERAEDAEMVEEWSDEANVFDLPTGFRYVVQGTDEQAGFIGVADLPAEHPLSARSRGRDLLKTEEGEAADQATADAIAARRLQESLQVTRRATVSHPLNLTMVNDVVELRPLGLVGPVVQRTITLGLGAVVEDVVRHIYTGGDLPWQ